MLMNIEAVTLLSLVVVWTLGTIAIYRLSREIAENAAFIDFVGSVMFWWLLLLVICGRAAWKAGAIYGERLVAWIDEKRNPRALRPGAENGLYE